MSMELKVLRHRMSSFVMRDILRYERGGTPESAHRLKPGLARSARVAGLYSGWYQIVVGVRGR